MSRRVLLVFAFAVLSAGCIPVTEPVGDIDKAEPDKNLVGKWDVASGRGTADVLKIQSLTVTAPVVEDNPKGLLRVVMVIDNRESPMWFFTTTVGKHTYANLIVGPMEGGEMPKFDEKGAFARWKKQEGKQYFISRIARDGDKLTLDCGNNDAFTALMKAENIKQAGNNAAIPYFETPAGWLAKYLDKTGPDKLFDGTNVLVLTREKK